jgi:hypothetical protein
MQLVVSNPAPPPPTLVPLFFCQFLYLGARDHIPLFSWGLKEVQILNPDDGQSPEPQW